MLVPASEICIKKWTLFPLIIRLKILNNHKIFIIFEAGHT